MEMQMKKIKIIIFIAALFTFFGCSNMIVELTNNEQQNTINQPENTQQQNTNNQSENTEQTPANNQTENNNQNENNEQSGTTNQSENNEQQNNNNQSGDNEQQGTNNQSNNNEQSGTNTQNETNNQSETNTPTENNGQQNTNNQSETNQQSGTNTQTENNEQQNTNNQSGNNEQSGTNTQNENNEQQNTNNQSQNNEQTNPQPKQYIVCYSTEHGTLPAFFIADEGYILTQNDLPELTALGFDFDGWFINETKLTPDTYSVTQNIVITAKWHKGNPTYTVKHVYYDFDDNPKVRDEEILQGPADTLTTAQAKEYYGFYPSTITQQTIKEDGSTIVTVNYNRETYTITLDLDGGIGETLISGKYEQKVIYEDPVKQNSIFSGWNTQDGFLPQTFTQNATYKALWKNQGSGFGLYIENDINSTIELTTQTQGNNIYITATPDLLNYNWKIDNAAPDETTEIVSEETPNVLVINNSWNKTRGVYSITVTANKNGIEYTGTVFVKIQ